MLHASGDSGTGYNLSVYDSCKCTGSLVTEIGELTSNTVNGCGPGDLIVSANIYNGLYNPDGNGAPVIWQWLS